MIAPRPAILIVNPQAGRLAHASREEVVAALRRSFRLDVVTSSRRGEAIDLAAAASDHGATLVIAFGGDGHVNEVANGIALSATSLGIIPGGTMNVFARALGIPTDPLDAIEHLVRMAAGSPRVVPLGRMDERYFTFSAGCGFDAEAAALVERDLKNKRRFGEMFFYWSAARVLVGAYRHRGPTMRLNSGDGEIPVAMVIASNAGPYAYLAGRPVRIAPRVLLERGLDAFALKRMRIEALPTYAWNCLVAGDVSQRRDALYLSDLKGFTVEADEPFARHVDGETIDPAVRAEVAVVPRALRVFA